DHPHLVRVLKVGTWTKAGNSFVYIVTEYAEENLAGVLAQRALTAEETLEREACDRAHGADQSSFSFSIAGTALRILYTRAHCDLCIQTLSAIWTLPPNGG